MPLTPSIAVVYTKHNPLATYCVAMLIFTFSYASLVCKSMCCKMYIFKMYMDADSLVCVLHNSFWWCYLICVNARWAHVMCTEKDSSTRLRLRLHVDLMEIMLAQYIVNIKVSSICIWVNSDGIKVKAKHKYISLPYQHFSIPRDLFQNVLCENPDQLYLKRRNGNESNFRRSISNVGQFRCIFICIQRLLFIRCNQLVCSNVGLYCVASPTFRRFFYVPRIPE